MEYGRRYDMSDIDRTVMDFFVLNKYADLQKDDDWDELLSELRQLFPVCGWCNRFLTVSQYTIFFVVFI